MIPAPGLLLNPRLPESEVSEFASLRPQLKPDHYWILSSGSTSARVSKVIGLSTEALRISARAVNAHLRARADDVWGLSLPTYHVGGLGILIRAELTGSVVVDLNPALEGRGFAEAARDFALRLFERNVTLLSLVPTQVYDLVDQRIPAPPALRAVVIGGAALAPDLYARGIELGWPLLPSFGMTECGSQIATAELDRGVSSADPRLRLLDHVEAKADAEGHLILRSAALLTGQFERGDDEKWVFRDPKVDGALRTQDRVEIDGPWLKPLGRATDFVKVKGEGVNLEDLRERFFADWSLEEKSRAVIVDLPDARDGAKLVLVLESATTGATIQQRLQAWNLGAFPPERLTDVRSIDRLPRTDLGKIAWAKLRQLLAHSDR